MKMQEFHFEQAKGGVEGAMAMDIGTFINPDQVRQVVVQVQEV